MLGERVERTAVVPCVQDVPKIGSLIRGVHGDYRAAEALCAFRVVEARNGLVDRLARNRESGVAGRNARATRVAPEDHVYLVDSAR